MPLVGIPFTVRDAFEGVENRTFGQSVGGLTGKRLRLVRQGRTFEDVCGDGSNFSFRRLAWDRPSPTLPRSGSLGNRYCYLFHPKEHRGLTVEEMKRVQSFPDGFVMPDAFAVAMNQVGNSVPSLMMLAVAEAVKGALDFGMETMALDGKRYADVLDEAWSAHLLPKAAGAPRVVSLFAGCGGSSLGYGMAGYRELLAVEWDADAAATFRLNFPDVPVHQGDIHGLSVEECLRLAGLQEGELDVLDGSPPCQSFSTAGKRRMGDERGWLWREYVRLLRGLRPRAFVMENVWGMVKGKMKLVFSECVREMKASGYAVRCALLDAKWFGVPQSRRRLIWVGLRDDVAAEPSHPAPERAWLSVNDALADMWGGGAEGVAAPFRHRDHLAAVKNDTHFDAWRSADAPSPTQGTRPGYALVTWRTRGGGAKTRTADGPSPTVTSGLEARDGRGRRSGRPGSSRSRTRSGSRGRRRPSSARSGTRCRRSSCGRSPPMSRACFFRRTARRDRPRHETGARVRVPQHVGGPETHGEPPEGAQFSVHAGVPGGIALQLGPPRGPVVGGALPCLAEQPPVPEVAVHEDRDAGGREGHVGRPRKGADVRPVPEAEPPHGAAQGHFRPRVLRPYPRHRARPDGVVRREVFVHVGIIPFSLSFVKGVSGQCINRGHTRWTWGRRP